MQSISLAPEQRVRRGSDVAEPNDSGDFVLYWMIANRRRRYNFSLQHAAGWAERLGKPLLVLEALRCGYRWASDRLHRFVMQGMADNAEDFEGSSATHWAYVESASGEGKGLIETLARRACLVVTDDYPAFFIPAMLRRAARLVPCRLDIVDSNGLVPMRLTEKPYARAYDFRRYLQQTLPDWLSRPPAADPLSDLKTPKFTPPSDWLRRWPMAEPRWLSEPSSLANLPIDHGVTAAPVAGGSRAATRQLDEFISDRFAGYGQDRNHPDRQGGSGLSPYLHFGHLSAHEVFQRVAECESWSPDLVEPARHGKRLGWWKMSENSESFLDELVTWRELGFNMCANRDDFDRYESLPTWALETLEAHAADPREYCYSLEEFASASTHDAVWNAAQTELVREGRIHNYLRMLWGKKILQWSQSPREAVRIMVELNNKYALDGRDPNSYSGIFWCCGRYDRAWGPERPIFGKIRYMSSESALRKVRMKEYLKRFSTSAEDH